ncbi:hypothetical protein Tco_0658346 [Tanacetum coccineum]
MENLNLFYQDIGTSSSTRRHLTQEEAAKEALAIRISQKFALLEEVKPVLKTMAYHDKYKKVLDEIWKDKVELDGMIMKEEEEAIKKVKGEALKEKDDPRAFIFPIRLEGQDKKDALADTGSDINTMPYQIYEQLEREEMKNVDRGITMINHTQAKAISDVLRTAENDSDDEEEYGIKRNKFGAPIYGLKPAPYLNCNDPAERSLALQAVINPFWKISIMGGNDDEAGSSRSKPSRQYETVEEVLLLQVHHEFLLWEGCNRDAKTRYNTKLANLLPRHVYSPCVVNWDVLNRIGCDGEIDDMLRIKLHEAESNEEIFTSVAWIRAFNIKEPIYSELCREFYSTYEFDEVYADDELQTKKIIKFRLGGRAHSLTLLEFARKLGLYHAEEVDEDGFNEPNFEGDSQDDHLWLVLKDYWMKRKRAGTQKESQICCGSFITKIARKARVLSDVVLRNLSAPIYCRDLDTTTLRELIDSEGRLIPEDPHPEVPRVAIPRPPRASTQDLYAGVFEHMAGVYSVDLQGAYNPLGYAQPLYDQYYQQYPPQPPQYQQQQDDDE